MEKTAAREAYFRFIKGAQDEDIEKQIRELQGKLSPVSPRHLAGVGAGGALLGPLGGGILGAIKAPKGSGWSSFGAGLGGGMVGTLPGAGLMALGRETQNKGLMALGQVLGMLGSGAGAAGGYYLANAPDEE